MTMVRTLTLNDGKKIPALGFGTGSFGHFGNHEEAAQDGAIALKAGFRHLDTAQLYDTEPAVRESIDKAGLSKDEVFVTSKCEASSTPVLRRVLMHSVR
jgi:2,5-diketo-D-gluconate reductase A